MNGTRERERGFTLIEMLIAVTLVAMMAVALWSALRISVTSWQRGAESVDANQRQRTVVGLVRKQMASLYGLIAPVDPQAGGNLYPMFSGTETSVQFISLASLRFLDSPGLTLVSYDVVQDRQGNYSLVEREEQYLGLELAAGTMPGRAEERAVRVFENLVSFMFEYYDPGTADTPSRWVREWDAKDSGRLPAAISMTMVALDDKGGRLNRHLVVPIHAKPWDPRLAFANPFLEIEYGVPNLGARARGEEP